MGARRRVYAIVGLLALAAAGATVAVTLATRTDTSAQAARSVPVPRKGAPPLALDLGVRLDPEAVALRRASQLYAAGRRSAAAAVFARYSSPEARLGSAFAAWPTGSLGAVQSLVRAHPHSALMRLHLGLALYWLGRDNDAVFAWRAAERVQPDSPSAIRAADLLHPRIAQGIPVFVPSFSSPSRIARLSPPRQLAALAAAARDGGAREKLLYGVALQRVGRPVSAEREFEQAAKLAPRDPEARVAAAVGRFDKDDPSRAFSQLGPLARVFPRAATVRFHLGLLLLWIGQLSEAKRQLRLAYADAPHSSLGKEANRFLERLVNIRTK
jgi:tetratricopeptide (TPR) repeat protein